VLAIDPSLGNVSYAERKTQELGWTNIEYAQADILKLGGADASVEVSAPAKSHAFYSMSDCRASRSTCRSAT
jgi:ubiquinone/menaquinone biosynthesis C-methylase UbiE